MLQPIVYWGATGHAKVLHEFAESTGFQLVALFDNDASVHPPFTDVPLFVGEEGFEYWRGRYQGAAASCLVAIGGTRGAHRVRLQRFMETNGLIPVIAIHPKAFVAADASLGKGSQILAMAAVCAGAQLGEACIVNTSASVDHECILGTGVHVGPGAHIAGCVRVGDHAMVGAGATVLPRLSIGRNAIVGAGAVVTRDVGDNQVVTGLPARFRNEAPSEL